jgi:hypothetical protein
VVVCGADRAGRAGCAAGRELTALLDDGSSESESSSEWRTAAAETPDDLELESELELAAAVCAVVGPEWSRHASTPPSESIAATLTAVAALRARAARGGRRMRVRVVSSMAVKVGTAGERLVRAR